MSEKVIDPASLLEQVRPEASARDRRLFEMRLAEEYDAEQAEQRAKDVKVGPVPEAQLVYNTATHTTGVAIRGAKRVCVLPKGYGGAGCELAAVEGNRFVVIQPDKPALLIDPETGTTRRL